jgi:hypothetical protein
MDEQALLHRVSVDTNVNIEFLKDLFQDERFWALLKAKKITDATMYVRKQSPYIGLRESQMVAEAFAESLK